MFGWFCSIQPYSKKNKPNIYFKKNILGGLNARTVPPFGIFIKETQKDNQNLIDHELKHWEQYQREGLISFLINYNREAITKGYDKNKYEIEARFIEDDYCKLNYTECVRNGKAKTVFNPNFRL